MSQSTGALLFRIIGSLAFLICLLEGARATADTISRERREGTLGLLLMAGLQGHKVVLAKLSSAAVQSLGIVLAILPAFAVPLLIGGVTAGECWRIMFTLMLALTLALAVGIAASSVASSGLLAISLALLMLFAISAPVLIAGAFSLSGVSDFAWLFGPLGLLLESQEARFVSGAWRFWSAAVVSIFLASAFLGFAMWRMQRHPNLESAPYAEASWLRWFRAGSGQSEAWGGDSTEAEPAVWLAERTLPGRRVLWLVIMLGALFSFFMGMFAGKAAAPLILGCSIFFALLVKLWLAAVAPQSLAESRRNGALELILCTPITADRIVRGQLEALTSYIFTPAIAVSMGFPMGSILGCIVGGNEEAIQRIIGTIWVGMVWLALFVLDVHALAYAGLWFGLTTSRVERAMAKTAFAVLLLPVLTLLVPLLGFAGVVGWPVFWIYWCSAKLRNRFREEAATPTAGLVRPEHGWWPWSRSASPNSAVE